MDTKLGEALTYIEKLVSWKWQIEKIISYQKYY